MKIKKCSKCGKTKQLSEFHKDSNQKGCLRSDCKVCRNNEIKQYYIKNKKQILKNKKEYRNINKKKLKLWFQNYYIKNKEILSEKRKINYQKNKEKIKKRTMQYTKNKLKNDINFRLTHNLRSRINKALNGFDKSLNTMFLIGCEIDYFMFHIQSQFTEGMNSDNYGLWHIDHIKPCASYDLSNSEEQRKCFHYSNLQPLWAEDNFKKGNR